MKKTLISLIFLFLFSTLTIPIASSINVSPLELSITMDESFIQGNSSKKITVRNSYDQPYNVTWYIDNPTPISSMRENKTYMPDLSWIVVEPKWVVIPPDKSEDFYIHLDIPETNENTDKNWETWVVFKGGEQEFGQGLFNFEYAVRVYIDTPQINISNEPVKQTDDLLIPIILVIVTAIAIVIIGYFVFKKKKS